jgi:hypothetical protein
VIPEGTFVLAASLRWLTLAALVGFVVRDILRPRLDVVRRTYGDDPDGGDFEGAPDDGLEKLRSGYASVRRNLLTLTGAPTTPAEPHSLPARTT